MQSSFLRPMTAAIAAVAVAAGAYVGWAGLAGAEESNPVPEPAVDDALAIPTAGLGSPQRLDDPSLLVVGQLLRLSFQARSAETRDLLRATVRFVDADGTTLDEQHLVVRLNGGDWRVGAATVTVPDRAAALELSWSALVGPVEVGDLGVAVTGSSAAQPPSDS